jgi:RimJ/RimL family protein N-acetyltransferase
MMTFRELPPEEWSRLVVFEPFATHGIPDGDAIAAWHILVAEDDNEIVGFTGLFNAPHWEPWWIAPAYRQHAGLVRGLVRLGLDTLSESQLVSVFVTVGDDAPEVQQLVERLGFTPAPGRLYLLYVPEIAIR